MSATAPGTSGAQPHAAGFSSRAAAVFGALHPAAGQPAWSLSEEAVFRTGKADYSSDEEVQAAVAEKWREETLPGGLLDMAGEGGAEAIKPSISFCQALDNEEEFDEADAIAAGRRGGDGESMPHLSTEVLEDNAYEHRSQAQSASEAMEVEQPIADQLPKLAEERSSVSGEDEDEVARSKARKRVRFQDDAAAAAPAAERDDRSNGRTAPGSQLRPQRRPQRGVRSSFVPDHVRNPGKYTCYALDEPLTVGGGGGGLVGDAEQVQATRAVQAAALAARGAGVDSLGGSQGVMALDAGLAVEDEAEVPMEVGGAKEGEAPAPAARRRVFRGRKHAAGDSGVS
ncbi:hypothetical protein WJX81_003052 [Elliptochloris bilobata]|uniref:U5 small nuclear ribonucleoprotein TSSC4 n=1 Tax=Elliptochloris bilobata TaxID=381761 RepID=A0AAW1SAY8_9CHLO